MPEYFFKTIYFPKNRVASNKAQRINLSFPNSQQRGCSENLLTHIKNLSSKDFRQALGDPILESLEQQAEDQSRSLSNVCLALLKDTYSRRENDSALEGGLGTVLVNEKIKKEKESIGVTFKDSLRKGTFGWYPYVEGFSATYARDALIRYGNTIKSVYDPFGGSGTTQLAAAKLGIKPYYSELNPFMSFIAEAKVISSVWARNNYTEYESVVDEYIDILGSTKFSSRSKAVSLDSYNEAFPNRNFFEIAHLKELLAALDIAKEITKDNSHLRKLLLCACAANAVSSSHMTRRADLRRRRQDEYKNRIVDVPKMISETLLRMKDDIYDMPLEMESMEKVSSNAKEIPTQYENTFDLVLTSPPYLNGTNYFRNTKIELWLLSFISSEKELKGFRENAVTGGINDVSKKEDYRIFNAVEVVASKLDIESKDKRIPTMVRHYFSDMSEVFDCVFKGLVSGGKLLLDIGDSKFYGVHVQTDKLLIDVAKRSGFNLLNEHVLARRVSRDKSKLVQVELVFEKPANIFTKKSLKNKISKFQKDLPYTNLPYSKKTWGNNLHSVCSYQGKLKPSMAHWLIKEFVPEGGSVLDPIGGVGTIPFEASMKGMRAVSNDKSPFAAQIAKAKLCPPSILDFEKELEIIKEEASLLRLSKADYKEAEFGLNASVEEYYHEETLKQILKLRKLYLTRDINTISESESFFWASMLHVLHGNRPYALSRTSHPITPFAPSGEAENKDVYLKVLEKAHRSLKDPLPEQFIKGSGIYGDFRDLPEKLNEKFDAIMTSPPFYGMRFDRPNWLRLWFCGWSETNFKEESLSFLERQQVKDIAVYNEFFNVCYKMLKGSGILIVHLGSGGRRDMAEEFKAISPNSFDLVGEVIENVETVSKHGVRDKGYTKAHSLLFFQPLV